MNSEVTFRDFMQIAKRRGHTAESLADRFRGKIENPSEFFERVMSCKWKGEDRSWVVIPYRSVIDFYNAELRYFQDSDRKQRQCACGCGLPVFDRKKWATPGCKKRQQRQTVTDMQKGVCQVVDFVEPRPGQNRRAAPVGLIHAKPGQSGL